MNGKVSAISMHAFPDVNIFQLNSKKAHWYQSWMICVKFSCDTNEQIYNDVVKMMLYFIHKPLNIIF